MDAAPTPPADPPPPPSPPSRVSTGAPSPPGWRPTWPAPVAPVHLRAHRRRALQPHLPGDRRRRPRLRPAPAPGQPRPGHRPRHGPRAHRHQRPAGDRRARPPHPRTVHRHRGQRRTLLRDVLRRGTHPPRRAGVVRGCPRPSGPTPVDSLVDTLARLHAVDVDAVGLGDFARREGYIARQLKRWHGQFEQSTLDGAPGPAVIDRAWEELSAKIPEQQGVAIVHGDYRLDNTVLDDDGDVIAILDWEICTLGDPLADLGLLLVYWAEAGDAEHSVLGVAPTALPGFATRAAADRAVRRGQRPRRVRPSPTTAPSGSGSWPASSRASTSATPGARRPATGAASTSSPTRVVRLGERALADVEAL